MAQYPPLDVFNQDDEKVGEAMLEEILEKGLIHRVAHILIEDESGNVLLQLRGPNVMTDPGTWGLSVGGFVDAGEDYTQAAKREIAEELGLEGVEPQAVDVRYEEAALDKYSVRRFVGNFKLTIPRDTKFHLQASEVDSVRWFTRGEIKELIERQDSRVSPYVRRWLGTYYLGHEDHKH